MKIFKHYSNDPCANIIRLLGLSSFVTILVLLYSGHEISSDLGLGLAIAGGVLLYVAKRLHEYNVIKSLKHQHK